MRKLLLAALLLAAPGIAWAQGMPPAYGPGVAGGGCSIATTSALGCIKPDGSTITVNGSGVASAIGGSATSVVVGTTTVGGGTTAYLLYNNAGTLGNEAVSSLSIALSQITGLGTGVATSLADNVGSAGPSSSTAVRSEHRRPAR